MVEVELADHVAQRRQRELLEAPAQVLHLVDGANRISDQKVNHRVHFHRHVVAGDDRLRLDFRDLLAQVERLAHRVEERDDRVQAGFGGAMVLPEPLDDLHLLLRHDLDRPQQDDDQHDRDPEEDERADCAHARATSRTMPSAPVTTIRVPVAIGSALRAAQSSPPTVTRPVPSVGSIWWVTTPWRPMSGAVRDGTPGPPSLPSRRERSVTSDTTITTMHVTSGTDRP